MSRFNDPRDIRAREEARAAEAAFWAAHYAGKDTLAAEAEAVAAVRAKPLPEPKVTHECVDALDEPGFPSDCEKCGGLERCGSCDEAIPEDSIDAYETRRGYWICHACIENGETE